MIARHEERADLWSRIAEPLDPEAIQWRIDSQPKQSNGKYFARFVAYVEANTVRERLDGVAPGEWDATLELLPTVPVINRDGVQTGVTYSFKCRLQILGVIREDVGSGKDYKQAATDALKRAAVRFGIAHELYAYGPNIVEVDGDGKFAKPVEDPAKAYARKHGNGSGAERVAPVAGNGNRPAAAPVSPPPPSSPASTPAEREPQPDCPVCSGSMYDNRATKRNLRAPDYKCKDRSCDGVIWPPKPGKEKQPVSYDGAGVDRDFSDEIPF